MRADATAFTGIVRRRARPGRSGPPPNAALARHRHAGAIGMIERERAARPEDLARLFVERANAGDVEGLVELYEPDAVLAFRPGQVVRGSEQIREVYEQLLVDRPVFTPGEPLPVLRNGEIALTATKLARGVTTAEVARRQPDGSSVGDRSAQPPSVGISKASLSSLCVAVLVAETSGVLRLQDLFLTYAYLYAAKRCPRQRTPENPRRCRLGWAKIKDRNSGPQQLWSWAKCLRGFNGREQILRDVPRLPLFRPVWTIRCGEPVRSRRASTRPGPRRACLFPGAPRACRRRRSRRPSP
ncbi:hypothetical protein A8924_4417 [Saccharopolyspora erythraea NRRL 2338]|nr:hypothetical protein A8924_4417 [Saccharopolyspora erythraea NRRL 2338]